MLRPFPAVLLLSCTLAAAQPPAPSFDLDVQRFAGADGGKGYQIRASGTVLATPAAAWRILTDYEHFADYVPNVTSARVLSRSGDSIVVEQQGAARYLFFQQPIRLMVLVREQAPHRIDIGLLDGDMKVYRASWELRPLDGAAGTRVVYNATVEPNFAVPFFVGTGVVREDVAKMMTAVFSRLQRQE